MGHWVREWVTESDGNRKWVEREVSRRFLRRTYVPADRTEENCVKRMWALLYTCPLVSHWRGDRRKACALSAASVRGRLLLIEVNCFSRIKSHDQSTRAFGINSILGQVHQPTRTPSEEARENTINIDVYSRSNGTLFRFSSSVPPTGCSIGAACNFGRARHQPQQYSRTSRATTSWLGVFESAWDSPGFPSQFLRNTFCSEQVILAPRISSAASTLSTYTPALLFRPASPWFWNFPSQVMYLALGAVDPTTLAVGNTFKRVFIIGASLVVFKTPISGMGVLGSAIAVGGVLVYSLTKQHYDSLDRRISEETKLR